MAANRIKGITIEIGGDTTKLQTALQGVNNNIKTTQSQLKDVERLLKLDPRNTELVAQQQKLLAQAVSDTKSKLSTLKTAAEQANKALADGKISKEQYNALKREIIDTEQALKKLEGQATRSNKAIAGLRNAGNKMTNAGMALAPASAVSGGLLGGAIKTAVDFEAAMSKVGAITKASDEDMRELTASAENMGRTTKFTAKEAADAMSYLGMAGWKTKQIVDGLPAVMKLAGAGGIDLARAADVVSDDLTAFGLKAKDAAHMADVYATTITNSNTNIEMMGETMKYAAPVARAFGISMEETAALTGMMGNAGIKASQAGTSIRGALLRLAGPPKAAASELDKLGITLSETSKAQMEASAELDALGISFDSSQQGAGKMASILSQLREKFKGMSEAEQTASAKAIFGANAVSGWLGVLNSGEGEFEKFVEQLRHCDGAVDTLYGRMNNNTKGSWTAFQSALEGLGKSIGDLFLPSLTMLIKALTGLTGILNAMPAPFKFLIGAVLGIVAAAAPLLIALGQMAIGMSVIMEKLPLLASMWAKLPNVFGLVSTAIGAVCSGLKAMFALMLANPVTLFVTALAALVGTIIYLWNTNEQFRNDVTALWNEVKTVFTSALGSVSSAFEGAREIISTKANDIFLSIKNCFTTPVEYIKNLIAQARNWGADLVTGIAEGIKSCIGKVKNAVAEVAQAIKSKLHFSRPDEGPLRDYEEWMPDFMEGLAKGIKANQSKVTKAITDVAGSMTLNPSVTTYGNDDSAVINLTQPLTIDGKTLTSIVTQIQYSNGRASLRNLGRV